MLEYILTATFSLLLSRFWVQQNNLEAASLFFSCYILMWVYLNTKKWPVHCSQKCVHKPLKIYPIFLYGQRSITQIGQLILHLFPACFWEDVVLIVLPPLLCCIAACGDKLWMQCKSCKICCIFHYLHVKGHKSSSVKSAIKKWQVLLSGFFIAYYLQWQQLLLHHCTAYHIICS